MWYAIQLINLSESALVNVEEGYNSLLYSLVILRTNIGSVSVGGAKVQCITTSTTAASQKSNIFINSIVASMKHHVELAQLQLMIAKPANLNHLHDDPYPQSASDVIGTLNICNACNWKILAILKKEITNKNQNQN